jgi:tetratricopeptide (TPR) repeat protein
MLASTLDRSARIAAACLVALTATGCANAPAVFGTRARFSPAYHGYVMATDNGSDDPGAHDQVLVLRDPLTGDKLRCREDVLAWRELHEDLAEDRVRDDNAAIAADVVANTLFLAAIVAQPVGAGLMAEAVLADARLYERLRSDSATTLLARGIVLYRRQRYPQAARAIERALAKDGTVGLLDKAYLYLGLSYHEQGHRDRARLALSMFLDRAAVRDVDAYRNAEALLRALDVARAPCASTEPVDLHW